MSNQWYGEKAGSKHHVAVWKAINEYADTHRYVTRDVAREKAVIEVENAIQEASDAVTSELRARIKDLEQRLKAIGHDISARSEMLEKQLDEHGRTFNPGGDEKPF